ncbi:MAG: hypothetical protein KAY32_02290 [Candidatus Eisenbacteria sp.]|nr:hypothetical protein [Candidatus Eisenbacteria bacterium]
MTRHHSALLALLAALVLTVGGCSFGFLGSKSDSGLRPTNVEVRIISQSCFQGEIEPCG